jgi:acyl-CoA thioesterase-2
MAKALDRLLELLDLEQIEVNIFRGRSPEERVQRVFGGQVAGQALVAAGRTVPADRPVHSLHAYFIRPGDPAVPIIYLVDRVRDGRSFTTRRVSAVQHGEAIFTLSASFHHDEPGPEHADPMPDVPPPERLPDWEDLRVAILGDPAARRPDGPLEIRECDPEAAVPAVGRPARRALWIRPRGVLPDDPLLHAAVLAFASDRGLLSTAARPHGLMWGVRQGASLDHALWLHGPVRLDDWMLSVSESPVAVAGRALVLGTLYARTGIRLASVAQEGFMRAAR